MHSPVGCYVHIPFCVRKCAYCDFNSYSGYTEAHIERYVQALTLEICRAQTTYGPVDTVFFGGGTPTAIPATDEAALLRAVRETLPITPDAEITTEANPGTMDVAHLASLRAAGFNRISLAFSPLMPGCSRRWTVFILRRRRRTPSGRPRRRVRERLPGPDVRSAAPDARPSGATRWTRRWPWRPITSRSTR